MISLKSFNPVLKHNGIRKLPLLKSLMQCKYYLSGQPFPAFERMPLRSIESSILKNVSLLY